jgi:hypothetical protein
MQSIYNRIVLETRGAPSTFTSFPRLPPEVQNMIWQIAIDSVRPRVVEVKENIELAPRSCRSKYGGKRQFISTCPIPGVLHACRASRSLALRRWRLCFAARYQEPKIFFDLEEDFLYFGRDFDNIRNFADAVDFKDRQATQLLAFHLRLQWASDYFYDGEDLSFVLFEDFPNVKVVLFPEYDLDELVEIGDRLRRRSSRLAKPEPPKAKRDPKKTVIRFCGTEREIDFESRSTQLVFDCLEAREDLGWIEPAMIRVDYYRADLSEFEYNEDRRRLELALFTKYRAEMFEKRKKRSRNCSTSESSHAENQDISTSAEETSIKTMSYLSGSGLLQILNDYRADMNF